MFKNILLLALCVFSFFSCKKDPLPTVEIPPVPQKFAFTETSQEINPNNADCWHWVWYEVVNDSLFKRVEFIDKGRYEKPYSFASYPTNAWGDQWAEQPLRLVTKKSDCTGEKCGIIVEVLKTGNDPVIKPGDYMATYNGWQILKTWQAGTESKGLLSGTINGHEAIIAPVFPFDGGTYDEKKMSWLVGYKE